MIFQIVRKGAESAIRAKQAANTHQEVFGGCLMCWQMPGIDQHQQWYIVK